MPVENAILQSCPACGASIDTTTADPLAKIACPKCGEKARVERSFNNFVLVETLGVGGMGTVYKARDTLLDRLVALKLLRKDLGAGIDQTAQLQQEARVAASVNHPNVIQVFSSGIDHSQFYLVMELVDHGSLDDFIEERKRLPEEQVLEAGIQVAKGLRAAHAKGLIHRDVKPANILFADEHTAKIGDFGLAGVAAERSGTAGEIWGTPYYVAPERLRNDPEDFRSDIYSLGATLFHAAAGKAPIEGDTNSAIELQALKKKPIDVRKIAPEIGRHCSRSSPDDCAGSRPPIRFLRRLGERAGARAPGIDRERNARWYFFREQKNAGVRHRRSGRDRIGIRCLSLAAKIAAASNIKSALVSIHCGFGGRTGTPICRWSTRIGPRSPQDCARSFCPSRPRRQKSSADLRLDPVESRLGRADQS